MLHEYVEFTRPEMVTVGDGHSVKAYGKGTFILHQGDITYEFTDTFYCPSLECNILSVSYLNLCGCDVMFTSKHGAEIRRADSTDVLLRASLHDGLFIIDPAKRHNSKHIVLPAHVASVLSSLPDTRSAPDVLEEISNSTPSVTETHRNISAKFRVTDPALWHGRLGHVSATTLKNMLAKDTVIGLPTWEELSSSYEHPCKDCLAGRFTAFHHPARNPDKYTMPMQCVFVDLTGPFIKSVDKCTMCLNMVDAYSGYTVSIPLKDKTLAHNAIIDGIQHMQMMSKHKAQEIRTDNDSIFHTPVFLTWASDRLIKITHSAPYTHQQIGIVERMNRTIGETTRSLLSHSNRNPILWSEAMPTSAYLHNRRASGSTFFCSSTSVKSSSSVRK
jgi:hypothetical protein